MSFSDDEIDNNMNQNQNNSSTITDELTLQIANMLRNEWPRDSATTIQS